MNKIALCWLLLLTPIMLFSQDFTREIRPAEPRMNGKDIIEIQQRLISLGFSEVGKVDGWYGPKTETAVRRYQEFLGFQPTGVVNLEVWEALFSKTSTLLQLNRDLASINSLAIYEYKKIEKDLPGLSTEGGSLTRYLDNGQAKYIEIELYFEMGKLYYRIYPIANRHLAVSIGYRYPKPFDLENAEIEYASYYYIENTTYEIINGLASKTKYDEIGLLEILDELEI